MDIFESRRKRLYAQMELSGVSCLLITPSADMQYLTDLTLLADERLLAAVFASGFVPFLIANQLQRAALENSPYQDIVYYRDGDDAASLLAGELNGRGIPTDHLAFDNAMAAELAVPILEAIPHQQCSVSAKVTAPLRMVKDAEEIARLRIACRKASDDLRKTMSTGRAWIGHTETELEEALCREMVR